MVSALGSPALPYSLFARSAQLKISSYFYQLFASREDDDAGALAEPAIQRAATKFSRREQGLSDQYDDEYRWTGIV